MLQPRYLPFASGRWQLSLGMQPLALAEWLDIDPEFEQQLQLKAQLLEHHAADVWISLPDTQLCQQEALELVLEHLFTHFPQHYRRRAGQIENLLTGQHWCEKDFAAMPLALAGRLIQEDLALLQPCANGYCLMAGCICFPLRWHPPTKLGQPLGEIHQPVPGYQPQLTRPVDKLLEKLRPEHPVWRLNWNLVETPELFLPQGADPAMLQQIDSENAGDRLWLRVERQCLRRLSRSNTILFSIHTYISPLSSLATVPEMGQALATAVTQMPIEMQLYKNIEPVRVALLGYLEQLQTTTDPQP